MIDISPAAVWSVGIAQAALTTLATMLTIGIAFLSKPGKPTLYWSMAFALSMLATFGVIAGELNDAESVRRICLGALMGAPALLWSGFRAHWGKRSFVWAGAIVSVASAAILVMVGESVYFSSAYRFVFLVAAAFAALFVIDWFRSADRRDTLLLPLLVLSALFVIAAVGSAVGGFVYPPTTGDDLTLVRIVGSLGMLAYVACALIAVLGISSRDSALLRRAGAVTQLQRFEETAADRLARAQHSAEPWSMVYLRLDDIEEIHQAAGGLVLTEMSERFENELRRAFPAESDIYSPEPGAAFVLVPRPDATVRDLLRISLERVAQLEIPGRLSIHPSVSAGWAPTSTVGYDVKALVYLSREAAALADQKGGDRWERVSATVVQRLLDPLTRL